MVTDAARRYLDQDKTEAPRCPSGIECGPARAFPERGRQWHLVRMGMPGRFLGLMRSTSAPPLAFLLCTRDGSERHTWRPVSWLHRLTPQQAGGTAARGGRSCDVSARPGGGARPLPAFLRSRFIVSQSVCWLSHICLPGVA